MKRKLLLLVLSLCIGNLTYSQTIELIGKGTVGTNNSNLSLTNLDNITKIDVGAVYKGGGALPLANTVLFSDENEGPMSVLNNDVIIKHFSTPSDNIGYFSSTFSSADAGGVNMVSMDTENVHSFYAFVYRDDPNATYKSFLNSQTTFYFRNGSTDAYVYDIPIETASEPRDITVRIPITELDAGSRIAVIDIVAGDMSEHDEVNTFNLGNSFFLGEYTFKDVPGDVSNVAVSIYSPNDLVGEVRGDSFFVSGVVADVEIVEEDPVCTYSQGYWKTHSKYDGDDKYNSTWAEISPDGEDTSFYLSQKSYYNVINKASRGNVYYVLARQFIAAKLNILNGADPADVKEAFDKANHLFGKYSPRQIAYLKYKRSRWAKKLKRHFVYLAKKLKDYNDGVTGPGNCKEDEEEPIPCLTKDDVVVTPNPIVTHGTVKFTPTHSGRTVVYMYNAWGQFVCPLYNQYTKEGEEVKFNLNGRNYRNGTYYIKIFSGCCVVVKRVAIHCY